MADRDSSTDTLSSTLAAIDLQGSQAEPTQLSNHHPPSTANIVNLAPIGFDNFQPGKRYVGRMIISVVREVERHNGLWLTGEDSSGNHGVIWSLIDNPIPGGEASIYASIIIAVNEPMFTIMNGQFVVCAHHPTDLVRLSTFDPLVADLLPTLVPKDIKAFSERGTAKQQKGKVLEAIKIFTEGIKQFSADAKNDSNVRGLLLKRSKAYIELEMHSPALADINELLRQNPEHREALILGCGLHMEFEDYDKAQRLAATLTRISSRRAAKEAKALADQVTARIEQANGEFDFNEMVTMIRQGSKVPTPSNFKGNIQVGESSLGGRGTFATSKIPRGEIILCEKPLVFHDEEMVCLSSHTGGVMNLLSGDEVLSRKQMSIIELMASISISNRQVHEGLHSLYRG